MPSIQSLRPLLEVEKREADEYMMDADADESIEDTLPQRRTATAAKFKWILLLALLVIITAIATASIYGYVLAAQASPYESLQNQNCNCGTSAAEAVANGCRFDPYSATWLPDRCWDEELFQVFESLKREQNHDFALYSWAKPPQQLSLDEAAQIAGDPWNITDNRIRTSQSWHYAHCLYILLKHFRRDATNLDMAPRYLSQEHAQHCATTLMNLVANDPKRHAVTGVSAVYVFDE